MAGVIVLTRGATKPWQWLRDGLANAIAADAVPLPCATGVRSRSSLAPCWARSPASWNSQSGFDGVSDLRAVPANGVLGEDVPHPAHSDWCRDSSFGTSLPMRTLERVCVFCGSHAGQQTAYVEAAAALGRCLARDGIGLVFGGGQVGLMGAIADAVLEAGGRVHGVIPEALATREVAHQNLTELHVVTGMHERKALMNELADAFIALPGGLGTFEELFEVLTWSQLGFHRKPVGVLNVAGYFDSLLEMLRRSLAEGFIPQANRDLLIVGGEPEELLRRLTTVVLPEVPRWIRRSEET